MQRLIDTAAYLHGYVIVDSKGEIEPNTFSSNRQRAWNKTGSQDAAHRRGLKRLGYRCEYAIIVCQKARKGKEV
jgi:hypothetical protein